MKTTAIIVAAGSGVRMGSPGPKAFLDLGGRPVVEHSLQAFQQHPGVDAIVVMVPPGMLDRARTLCGRYPKVIAVAEGGARRQDTVALGLRQARAAGGAGGPDDIVLVHDAARPLVDAATIGAVREAAHRAGAAVPGVPPDDTVREVPGAGNEGQPRAPGTLDRSRLVMVQTPQGFRLDLLEKAHGAAQGADVTDDASLVERLGVAVEVVPGSPRNFKLTSPADLERARALLGERREGMFRVGIGYDLHRFSTSAGRPLRLGGVDVPADRGLEGHSDADVLLHSVCDAVLGALGLGDIGRHFPDSDPHLKGVSSVVLLEKVAALMHERGWRIMNLDAVIIAQTPRVAPHTDAMRRAIAAALGADPADVNIKGTSPEEMGSLGRREGIAAETVALLGKPA
jgi:2-C-methyl-D-erythritol 4-phosphate cytidylyltransferase/2-C-methyl-D-erythritol 2,4-cyclodiphosphate synthase